MTFRTSARAALAALLAAALSLGVAACSDDGTKPGGGSGSGSGSGSKAQ